MDNGKYTIHKHFNGYQYREDQKVTVYRNVGFKDSDIEQVCRQIAQFCEQSKDEVNSPNNRGRCAGFIGSASKLLIIAESLRKQGYLVGEYNGRN